MLVKKTVILLGILIAGFALAFLSTQSAHAAPFVDFPVTVTQPDGTQLDLFASGDEFYNWLHDAQGYTVIQDPDSGYYVYADLVNGALVPTTYVAGTLDPASVGLHPYINISPDKKTSIRQAFLEKTEQSGGEITSAITSGTLTNLVVFIRFSGETEFTNPLSKYTDMLNSSAVGEDSLYNYYWEVSYNTLTINSPLFPIPATTVISYQDTHPRSYFQPYNAVSNPGGYTGGDNGSMRTSREHTLLRDAITYVNGLGQFPAGATIDADGDGYVDSLTFIVSGGPNGWASLLWPHAWSLYSYTVMISGKIVSDYNFQLDSMLNTGVLAHEMFHVLGAPDLYHYTSNGITPVGGWDLMEVDADPPESMGCYMKYKYGHWISSIPELASTGTYSLNPLTSPTDNCKKIASPFSTTEFFIVEYRNKSGTFESSLPGTGMLVYRINTNANGNAGGPPDEIYLYRPGGTPSVDGSLNTAYFSSTAGRTAINDWTDPYSFLSNGGPGGLNICNVGAAAATISFDICPALAAETISGHVLTGTGTAISGVAMNGLPHSTVTDSNGFYSAAVYAGWSGTVTPFKFNDVFLPPHLDYANVTSDQAGQDYTGAYQPSGNRILLVDDDDNTPDVRSYYTATLTALGRSYDVWDTNNSDTEPSATDLVPYDTVIWFTGHEYGGYAGPGSSGGSALGSWLDAGGCFLISSQDYYYDNGNKVDTFMSTYLGVSAATSDVSQTTVTGAGSVFSGLGPYSLSYPFTNYSDLVSPAAAAETGFSGNKGSAAVDKMGGGYRTAFLGFPFEAISALSDRQQVLGGFLNWCHPYHNYLPLVIR
jgi:M6 family metalloprotease-like protein